MNLLNFKKNIYSQNGEDGIIEQIFEIIGEENKTCCEFGAWDGIYLSNCKRLIEKGWKAIMIEADTAKYEELVNNYKNNSSVLAINKFVDTNENKLSSICKNSGFNELDFLSIDIDGLDYEIFEDLDINARVICIEVNAGHNPEKYYKLEKEIVKYNVGQPLQYFNKIAEKKGYKLICYNSNAFYLKKEIFDSCSLQEITCKDAYISYLNFLSPLEKEWMYLVNLGKVTPFYNYKNKFLSRRSLKISFLRSIYLYIYSSNFYKKNINLKKRIFSKINRILKK